MLRLFLGRWVLGGSMVDWGGLFIGWLRRGFRFGGVTGGLAPAFVSLSGQGCARRPLHVRVGGGCGVG